MSKNPREKGAVNEQSLQEIAGPQARTETYASTSSSSSEESLKHWIRADKDAPNDIKGSSKREELKYPTAIVYDSEKCTLEAHNRESLQSEQRMTVYGKLPSRTSRNIFVYIECLSSVGGGSQPQFRITASKRIPLGFRPYCTIHLNYLSWYTRAQILGGKHKWIYLIIRDTDCRRALVNE